MAINLVNASSHRTASSVQEGLILDAGATARVLLLLLLLLGGHVVRVLVPTQIDLDVDSTLRLQVNPKVLLIVLVPRHQIVERDRHVGHEHVRDGTLVEYRHAEDVGIFHLVDEAFVPYRVECALFCRGSIYEVLVDVYRGIRIDELLISESPECHRVARLEVRGSQTARLADLQAQGTRKHSAADGFVLVVVVVSYPPGFVLLHRS